MKKIALGLVFSILINLSFPTLSVFADTKEENNLVINILDNTNITEYSELDRVILSPQNLQIDPNLTNGAFAIGSFASTFFAPQSLAIAGGTALILYLGYKLYDQYKQHLDSNNKLQVTSDMIGSMRESLLNIVGSTNVIEFTGAVPIAPTGTISATQVVNNGIHLAHSITSTNNVFFVKNYRPTRFKLTSYSTIDGDTATSTYATRDFSLSSGFMLLPVVSCSVWDDKTWTTQSGFRTSYDMKNYGGIAVNYGDSTVDYRGTIQTAYLNYELINSSGNVPSEIVAENEQVGYEVTVPSDILEVPTAPVIDKPILPGTSFAPPTVDIGKTPIQNIPMEDVVQPQLPTDTPTNPETPPQTGNLTGLAEILQAVFQPLFDFIANFFSRLGNLLLDIFRPIFNVATDIINGIKNIIIEIFTPLFEWIAKFMTDLYTKLKELAIELFKPTIDLKEAFEIPEDKFVPIQDLEVNYLELTPKPIRFETDLKFGSIEYHVKLNFDEVDIITTNLDLIRNVFSYTLLLVSILGVIEIFKPKRVMD